MKVINSYVMKKHENKKNVVIEMHGTGISLCEQGILLLGNSGSGKTTLAIEMISKNIKEKGVISNDRVFIKDGVMQYFPIPIVIASGTAKNNKYLDEYFTNSRLYEKRTGKVYENTLNNDKVPIPLTDIEKIFKDVGMDKKEKF